MLPDTLHQLPRTERFAYAKLLAVMARANDELTVEEMATFEQRLGTALLSPEQRNQIRAYLKSPPTLEECLKVAYNDIKDRKGHMNSHGVFIKEGDVA